MHGDEKEPRRDNGAKGTTLTRNGPSTAKRLHRLRCKLADKRAERAKHCREFWRLPLWSRAETVARRKMVRAQSAVLKLRAELEALEGVR